MPGLEDAQLGACLTTLGLLASPDGCRVTRPGEGNLNYVRRVTAADGRSWILKQARPGVEDFPEFPLSPDRVLFEQAYDETVRALLPAEWVILPEIQAFDADAHLLVLEDLGPVASLQEALRAGEAPMDVLYEVGAFLGRVHTSSQPLARELVERFDNGEMRQLHGTTLFDAPFSADLPDVAAPLCEVMDGVCSDPEVRSRVADLRRSYFTSRQGLVHGDVKCANILLGARGPRLIDAEFAHVGDCAFDLGTAVGHVHLCMDPGVAPGLRRGAHDALLDGYASTGPEPSATRRRALGYAGVDMIAHVVGPSRLPFLRELERAMPALECGLSLLLT